MRGVVRDRYGSPEVLKLAETPTPAPGSGEVLIRVRAASVNAGDWRILRADPFLIRLMGYGVLTPRHPVLGSVASRRAEEMEISDSSRPRRPPRISCS